MTLPLTLKRAMTFLFLLAAMAPLLLPTIPVSSDALKHLLAARVIAEYDNPTLGYAREFVLEVQPQSTALATLFLSALVKIVEPIVALKVYLALFVISLYAAGRFLCRSVGLPPAAALMLLPLANSYFVFAGLLPFIPTMVLYPLLLGVLLGAEQGWRRWILLSLLAVTMYAFHISGWAAGCFAVVAIALLRQAGRRALYDVSALTPSVFIAALFLLSREGGYSNMTWFPWSRLVTGYFVYNAVSLSRISTLLTLASYGALIATSLFCLWRRRGDRVLFIVAGLLSLIGIAMPMQIADWFIVGPRTWPFAVMTCVAAVPWKETTLRRGIGVAAICLFASSIGNTTKMFEVQKVYQPFLAGMEQIAMGSRVLPVVSDPYLVGNQYIPPFWGISDLYTVYRGGSNPYVFARPHLKTGGALIRYRHKPEYSGALYSHGPRSYSGVSRSYDHVILTGNQPEIAAQVGAEMCLAYRNDIVSVFSRCTAVIER